MTALLYVYKQKKINLFKLLIFIFRMGWWVVEKLLILHINLNIEEKRICFNINL